MKYLKSCSLALLLFMNLNSFANSAIDSSACDLDSVKKTAIEIQLSIGGGLIRNELAPEWTAGLVYKMKKDYSISVNISGMYFFERNLDRKFKMYDNYFAGAEFGLREKGEKDHTSGCGLNYLFSRKGDYFSGTTMKIYYFTDFDWIQLKPFFIFTNDFKTVFPGISIAF